jgi:SAM-dependent methyltransferase
VGGKVSLSVADPKLGEILTRALDVGPDERATQSHVHGFHSYAARLHPVTAERLIAGLSQGRQHVLDPFCGSGTVLVEARLAGRRATGSDLNPLAIELAWLKTRGFSKNECHELLEAAHLVAEHAEERRLDRAGPTKPYGRVDRDLFEPHTLLELDGVRDGIRTLDDRLHRRVLSLVLSALLIKVSRKPGDTAGSRRERRLAAGFVGRFFIDKTTELAERLTAFSNDVPRGTPSANVRIGDARQLEGVQPASVNLIITSPPYPGVYDYHEHHAARLRWLGLESGAFERSEIGSRRRLEHLPFARALGAWERDLIDSLRAVRRVLADEGRAALVLADTTLSDRAVRSDEAVRRASGKADLVVVGCASQNRPSFNRSARNAFREQPRREHAIVLGPA